MIAVKQNGIVLQYAAGSLEDDIEVVMTAVAENPYALRRNLCSKSLSKGCF